MSAGVEPTELVAGAWQLRPWPSAHADLDQVLAERYGVDERAAQRARRLEGWVTGELLCFAVREITTGASVAESAVVREAGAPVRFETWARPSHDATSITSVVEAVVRRWAAGALEPDTG